MDRRLSLGILLVFVATLIVLPSLVFAQSQNSWAQVCSSSGVGYPGFLPYLFQGENFYNNPGCSMRIVSGAGADPDGQGNTYYYTPAEFYTTPASLLKVSFFYKPSVTFQDSTWRRLYYNIQFAGDGTPETTVSGQDDYDCHYVVQSQTCNANGWKKVTIDLGSSYAPNGFTSIRLTFPVSDWQQFDWYVDQIYILNTYSVPTPTPTSTATPTPTPTPTGEACFNVDSSYLSQLFEVRINNPGSNFPNLPLSPVGEVPHNGYYIGSVFIQTVNPITVSHFVFDVSGTASRSNNLYVGQNSQTSYSSFWSPGGGTYSDIVTYTTSYPTDARHYNFTLERSNFTSGESGNVFLNGLTICSGFLPTPTPTPTSTITATPTITTTPPAFDDPCGAPSGLVSRWSFDETIGTRSDSGGNYNLTSFGGVSQGQDSHGAYADFTGSSYDFLYNQAFDVPNGAFSVAGWVNFDSLPTSGTDGFLTEDGSFGLTVNGSGDIQFAIPGTSAMSGAAGGGSWVHVAAILDPDNSQTTLCLDGSCSSQATGLTAAPQSAAALVFGAAGDYGAISDNFSGFMDEWRVYNRALSQADVTTLYQCDAALATPTPGATGQPTIPPPTATPTPGSGGGGGPGDGWGWLDFLVWLIGKLFEFLMFILGPLLDLVYFLVWLIIKIVELIGLLLWALWWAFRFALGLITGMVSDIDTATPVTPLELGDYGTGYNFIRNLLASTPFSVIIYLINALLWFTFIRWAIAQFSDLQ